MEVAPNYLYLSGHLACSREAQDVSRNRKSNDIIMLARNNLREVSTGMWLCVVLLVGTLSPTASAVTTASTSTATTVSAAGTDSEYSISVRSVGQTW